MKLNKIHQGDCLDLLKQMDSEIVDMCMTSPPYWGLRDYGVDGQIGLEDHPNKYIEKMVEICKEIKRVLKKSGSFYLNVGDMYWGSHGGKGTDPSKCKESYVIPYETVSLRHGSKSIWLQPKQLMLMPSRLAIALQDDGWILRNDIIWHKPNPMPSSVKDRLNTTYEHLFHFVKHKKYYYDLDSIREPHKYPDGPSSPDSCGKKYSDYRTKGWKDHKFCHPKGKNPGDVIKTQGEHLGSPRARISREGYDAENHFYHPSGKNPGDFMSITTQPFSDYFCSNCGYFGLLLSIDEKEGYFGGKEKSERVCPNCKNKINISHFAIFPEALIERPIKSSCPEGGIVLDPFIGAGTTALVALKLNRKFIGIELKKEYIDLANKRIKPYLEQQRLKL